MKAGGKKLVGCLTLICLLPGCQSSPPGQPEGSSSPLATRNNCYSLLHQLLSQEKDVSLLRFIKREDSDLKEVIKNVTTTSRLASERLEDYAKKDPSLHLGYYALPPGEIQTRADISAQAEYELLHTSGIPFEETLLLTQIEAVNYAAHLAKIASNNDTNHERVLYLTGLSRQMGLLHDKMVSMITLQDTNSPPVSRK